MYPDDCQYTKEHEWVRLEDGIAVVGITDYARIILATWCSSSCPTSGRK